MTGPFAVGGKSKIAMAKLTLAGTYATNGFTINPKDFGMQYLQDFVADAGSGYVSYFDATNMKVVLYTAPAAATHTHAAGTLANTTPAFYGTAATITPGVTVGAPTFYGTTATISPTAALAANPRITIADGTGASLVYYDGSTHSFYTPGGGYTDADSPAIAVTGASYTPAGNITQGAVTVTGASYTPAGTISIPAISGSTADGGAISASVLSELTNATSVASVVINVTAIGN